MDLIDNIQRVLNKDGVIIYPTDTILGLGCLPTHERAVTKIKRLKGRDTSKGLILLATDLSQVSAYLLPTEPEKQHLREGTLLNSEQPTTWIINAKPNVLPWLTAGDNTLAIRFAKLPWLQNVCERVGALVSTSVNLSGYAPALETKTARDLVGPQVDLVIHKRIASTGKPSVIRRAVDGSIIRGNE